MEHTVCQPGQADGKEGRWRKLLEAEAPGRDAQIGPQVPAWHGCLHFPRSSRQAPGLSRRRVGPCMPGAQHTWEPRPGKSATGRFGRSQAVLTEKGGVLGRGRSCPFSPTLCARSRSGSPMRQPHTWSPRDWTGLLWAARRSNQSS